MICLTRDELRELTGLKRPSAILANLNANGIPVVSIGADDWPRVMRDFSKVTPKTLTQSGPNLAALKEMQNGARPSKPKRPT